jgi:hypothetical protein
MRLLTWSDMLPSIFAEDVEAVQVKLDACSGD